MAGSEKKPGGEKGDPKALVGEVLKKWVQPFNKKKPGNPKSREGEAPLERKIWNGRRPRRFREGSRKNSGHAKNLMRKKAKGKEKVEDFEKNLR